MAKFCNKCGKPLVDGICPDCSKKDEQKERTEVEASESNLLTDYLDILKGMFTSPVKTMEKNITEKNFPIGILSIVICSVLFGIFMHVLISNIFSSVGLDMSIISAGIESLNAKIAAMGVSFPTLGSIGVKMAIFFALASVIMAGLIYLMNSIIFKKKLDFKKIITMIGIIEITFSVCLLVAIIASFIHYVLAFIIIIVAIAILLVHLHQGILVIATMTKTQTFYTIALCVGLAIIAFILAFVTTLMALILALAMQDVTNTISRNGIGL